jgi:hypothetical protein
MMDNEQIIHEFLLKFKGFKKGVKMHLTDTIRREIVKDLRFNTEDAINYILNSGYFKLEMHDAVSLTDEGFKYANQTHY